MEIKNFIRFLLVFILGVILINEFFELVVSEYVRNLNLNVITYFTNVVYGFIVFFIVKKLGIKKSSN